MWTAKSTVVQNMICKERCCETIPNTSRETMWFCFLFSSSPPERHFSVSPHSFLCDLLPLLRYTIFPEGSSDRPTGTDWKGCPAVEGFELATDFQVEKSWYWPLDYRWSRGESLTEWLIWGFAAGEQNGEFGAVDVFHIWLKSRVR